MPTCGQRWKRHRPQTLCVQSPLGWTSRWSRADATFPADRSSASALDYATDAALRKALAALPGALTVFIVSQRAASLQHADQILVLDDGHLVGIGTHSALRSSCPVYEEIYESQFKKGEAEA